MKFTAFEAIAKSTAITVGFVGLIALSFLLGGCTPPYRKAFDDAATTNHWTKKEELLAFAYADKIFWAHQLKDGTYVLLYSRVPISKVASQTKQILDDFDDIQSPKAQEWRKYAEVFNLKQDFEHEEEIEKTIYTRIHAADLENQFKQGLGEEMTSGPDAEALAGYSLKRIYVNKPLAEAFPFQSEQVEGAKKDGTLKEIEHGELDLSSTYDHKDVNPNNPDDPEDFHWKSHTISIRLTNYKIINTDKPSDNKGNYIEGYRVIDGKQEQYPCLKIFFPQSARGALVLVDTAREGEPGYGAPDVLETIYSLDNVRDVIQNGTLIDSLFAEKKKDKRQVEPPQIFKVEISPIDVTGDTWEHSATGYVVPFKYRMGLGDNYNVRVKFDKPEADPNDPNAMVTAMNGYLDVEWIAKEYTVVGEQTQAGPGQVIEYYRPKPGYDKKVKADVLYSDDTKKIEFQLPDGTTFTGTISPGPNKFIEDKPFAVAYTEGEKRYWIEKEGSDLYTKRKRISPPKESTGNYTEEGDLYDKTSKVGPTAGDKK
jgi:hypothetical protein